MIEITPAKAGHDRRLDSKKAGRSGRAAERGSFDSVLSSAVGQESEIAIDVLLDDLKDQEKRFLDAQSLFELQKYKNLLQKILKHLLDDSYEKVTIPRRRRDKADYVIINIINDKVESLTKTLATTQNKAFALMKTLEEIRGLICDLRH
jgi:uncharacterized protein